MPELEQCPRRGRVSDTNGCPGLGVVAWIRRVRTASGVTAVQIAEYDGGQRKIVAHAGSAHTEAELGILLERARELLADPAQGGHQETAR